VARNDSAISVVTLKKERPYIQIVPIRISQGPVTRVTSEEEENSAAPEEEDYDGGESCAEENSTCEKKAGAGYPSSVVRGTNGFGWSDGVRQILARRRKRSQDD
jgi:hypothetical protein